MDLREVNLFEPLGDLDLEQLVVNTILEPSPHLLRLLDVVENPTHHKRKSSCQAFFSIPFAVKINQRGFTKIKRKIYVIYLRVPVPVSKIMDL